MVYTISPDLIRNIEKDEMYYFSDVLFVFAQRNSPFKVAVDIKNIVLKNYAEINNHNAHMIKNWLELMSFKPSPFEKIDVDLENINCEETRFLKLCKETTNQKKIVLYSKQNLKNFICQNDFVEFEENKIKILDRDNAVQELNAKAKTIINQIGDHNKASTGDNSPNS